MDRPNDSGETPQMSAEPASDVLELLQSESWERRLEAAREQREKVLAQKGSTRRLFRATAPGWSPDVTPDDLDRTAPFPEADEATPPATSPHLTLVRPQAEQRPAAGREAEEEFEALDAFEPAPPPLPRPRPVAPTVVTPLRPARALEPAAAPPVPVAAPSGQSAPATAAVRTLPVGRVVMGFALGLGVGVGLGTAVWLFRPAAPVAPSSVQTTTVAPIEPLVLPAAAAVVGSLAPFVATLAPKAPAMEVWSDGVPRAPEPVSAILAGSPAPLAIAPAAGLPPQFGPLVAFGTATGPSALTPIAPPTLADLFTMVPAAAVIQRPEPLALLTPAVLVADPALSPIELLARPLLGQAPAPLALPSEGGQSPGPGFAAVLPPAAARPSDLALASAPIGDPDTPVTADVTTAPPGWPLHVVKLLAPQGTDGRTIAGAEAQLTRAGFMTAEPARVDVTIKGSQVRYFHAEDRPLAEALSTELGYRLRDFTSGTNAPPPGTVEVWFKGGGPAAVAAKPASTKKKAPAKAARQPTAPAPMAQAPDLAGKSAKIASKFRLGDFK